MADNDRYVSGDQGDYFFIHNCFGSFFKGVLNWFGDDFYPRFNYRVIGTYEKSVEYFNKKKQLGHEVDTNLLPSISLDPQLDFAQEERAGRFLWQSPNNVPYFSAKLFDSVKLGDQEISVTPVFSRYQGTFELTFWLESIYELIDFRMMLLQFTGGFGRVIRPDFFWSHIILPDEIYNFETDDNTPLDWSETDDTILHINSINQERHTLPVVLTPTMKLESFADASTKYANDQIAEYKLTATFNYEINLPTYMVLRKTGGKISLGFSMGTAKTRYGIASPVTMVENIESSDVAEFKNIGNNIKVYRAIETEIEKTSLIMSSDTSSVYPESLEAQDWDPIARGILKYVPVADISTIEFNKSDILLIEDYHNQYLPLIRKASAVICKNGRREKELYKKTLLNTTPTLSQLGDDDYEKLLTNDGERVTFDPNTKSVYYGFVGSEEVCETDPEYAYDVIKSFKSSHPDEYNNILKRFPLSKVYTHQMCSKTKHGLGLLIAEETDGIQTTFEIGIDIKDLQRLSLYVNDDYQRQSQDYDDNETDSVYKIVDGEIVFFVAPAQGSKITILSDAMTIRDYELNSIYEFTDEDLVREDDIVIDLPFNVTDLAQIRLTSYPGELVPERDYEINLEEQSLKVMLKPKEDEVIEIFKGLN